MMICTSDQHLFDYGPKRILAIMGSIIATGLALGWTVEKLEMLYIELAEQVFQKSIWRQGFLQAKFPAQFDM